MLSRCSWIVLVVAVAALMSSPLRAAENPVGTWVGTTEVPDQGADQVTLTVKKVKDGYTATVADSLNQVSREEVEARFADGVLTIGFSLTDGTRMTMTLKVTGDKMAGEWAHPEGAVGTIAFERKKA
jgi:hypothetical protein